MAFIEVKKLSTIDRTVAGAGALALISMFLPWYGATSGVFNASVSGFGSGYGWIGVLLVTAAGVYLAMLRSGSQVPKTSMGPGVLVLGASAIGTLLIAVRWISLPRGNVSASGVALYSYGPRFGIILALLASVVQVACALTLFRRSGEALPWAK
jgi:hypothetical protein